MALDKDILRTIKVKQDEAIIPFVSTFNPKDPEIFPVIINNLPILEKDEKMKGIISKYKFIKSKRQPYNLKHLLIKQISLQIMNTQWKNVIDRTAATAFIY